MHSKTTTHSKKGGYKTLDELSYKLWRLLVWRWLMMGLFHLFKLKTSRLTSKTHKWKCQVNLVPSSQVKQNFINPKWKLQIWMLKNKKIYNNQLQFKLKLHSFYNLHLWSTFSWNRLCINKIWCMEDNHSYVSHTCKRVSVIQTVIKQLLTK